MKQSLFLFVGCLLFINNSLLASNSSITTDKDLILFEENNGQFVDMNGNLVPHVLFKMQAHGIDLYVTETGLTYVFQKIINETSTSTNPELETLEQTINSRIQWERVDLLLGRASIRKENVVKEGELSQGKLNYFLAHCPDGIRNVSQYEKIIIKDIYPNIDWVLYNTSDYGFKYDFILRSGANIEDIELIYRMKTPLKMNNGEIHIMTQYGSLIENKPVSFLNGRSIQSTFSLNSTIPNRYNGYDCRVSFTFDQEVYDQLADESIENELIIDPELQWSTFYGGSNNDEAQCIIADSENNVYLAGFNQNIDFPLDNLTGYFQGSNNGSLDGFILKFNSEGVRMWSTLYGGWGIDHFYGIDIDSDDNLYVGGMSLSGSFPTQDNGTFYQANINGGSDGVLLKFNGAGDRLWATYIGGSEDEEIYSLATYNGGVYVAGFTLSDDFPIQSQGTFMQSAIGGGMDGTIQKFDSDGNLIWSTYYGGANSDRPATICVDNLENVYVTGMTISDDFNVIDAGGYYSSSLSGTIDAFLLKFDPTGNLNWSTYYGGSEKDMGMGIVVDEYNNVFLSGYSNSNDIPLLDAGTFFQDYYPFSPGSSMIPFFTKFDESGVLLWATYFGHQHTYTWRQQHVLVIDDCNNIFYSMSDTYDQEENFPFCEGGFTNDHTSYINSGFLLKFSNDGDMMGRTHISGNLNDGFDNIIAAGRDDVLWYSMTAMEVGPNPVDNSSYPLVSGEIGAYHDNTHNGASDILLMKFYTDPEYFNECECIPVFSVECPNVFTPNGDDVNDVFQLNVENAQNIEMIILNKWGNVVYSDSGDWVTWDGTTQSGLEANDGVYFIKYIVTDTEGNSINGHGYLHLFRD